MSYAGHHPVHAGLQNESVGDTYPFTIVGYGQGDKVLYVIENICTGQVVGFNRNRNHDSGPRQWSYPPKDFLRKVAAGHKHDACREPIVLHDKGRPVFQDGILVWPDKLLGTVRVVFPTRSTEPKRPLTPLEEYHAALEQDIG